MRRGGLFLVQDADAVAAQLFFGIAEHPLDRRVHSVDAAARIECDDPVLGAVQDHAKPFGGIFLRQGVNRHPLRSLTVTSKVQRARQLLGPIPPWLPGITICWTFVSGKSSLRAFLWGTRMSYKVREAAAVTLLIALGVFNITSAIQNVY